MTRVRTTATGDAYVGLEAPTQAEWDDWHRAMLDERAAVIARAHLDLGAYDDPATAWSDATFRQAFVFMYDASFYDRAADRYRTPELLARWSAMFGRVDSALLWHAYPRLGFDARTQFDFYRDMPGGLARLRSDVSDVLHAAGVRVFVDYNPWDAGSYDELAEIVQALDADGVMLDTMAASPEQLSRAVSARREGVVLSPELRPRDEDLGALRQSWAQWFDVGGAGTPSIYRHRWIAPRHRQLAIRRWDASRQGDIVYAFFNGSGLLLWDDIFGAWNPYSRQDRRLVAETAAVIDRYGDLLARGEWRPLVPTGVAGLDANHWSEGPPGAGRAIVTLRNRAATPLRYRIRDEAPAGWEYVAFWGEPRAVRAGDEIEVPPGGAQALALDLPERAHEALAHFRRLSARADVPLEDYDPRAPVVRAVGRGVDPAPAPSGARGQPNARGQRDARWIDLPGGAFEMRVAHPRRECGCYPFGATADATWGWFHQDTVTHALRVDLAPFSIRATAVTNGDFVAFVHASGYRPADPERFLQHLARGRELSPDVEALPVTFVSLADARAYAAWHGERLPTEAEWQWAAEGAGAGHRHPWGDEARTFPDALRPALDPDTATPQGVMGLSGNAWELTESEYDDGHTRFVLLRGGVHLPPGQSEWLPPRGPRPNDSHAKYLLLSDGLDRSATISFRTVVARG